jgi:hypothetical protein
MALQPWHSRRVVGMTAEPFIGVWRRMVNVGLAFRG